MSKIAVDKILPNPEQPRKAFDQAEIGSLADSIRQHGLINPITVEQAGGCYILIDGERRWRAAKLAGLGQIDATIRPAMNGKGGQERLVLALVANLQRSDLTPTEEARAYQKMRDAGMTNIRIGNCVGKSAAHVVQCLSLLGLDDEIQTLVDEGLLPKDARIVDALLSIQDRDIRIRLARRAARPGVTIKTIVAACQKLNDAMTARRLEHPALELAEKRTEIKQPTAKWTALQQLGRLPPWELVRSAVLKTCRECVLIGCASEITCRECPAVDLLRILIGISDG
jgi:ParB family chromosome partitioning protein